MTILRLNHNPVQFNLLKMAIFHPDLKVVLNINHLLPMSNLQVKQKVSPEVLLLKSLNPNPVRFNQLNLKVVHNNKHLLPVMKLNLKSKFSPVVAPPNPLKLLLFHTQVLKLVTFQLNLMGFQSKKVLMVLLLYQLVLSQLLLLKLLRLLLFLSQLVLGTMCQLHLKG